MPSHETTREVAHSAAEMFDLVADVEAYPQFVPLCEKLVVRRTTERNGVTILVADMTVAYALFRETFTSKVVLDRANFAIDVEYIDGPFSSLINNWRFRARGDHACEVEFKIAWEMRSRAFAMVVGAVFDRAFRRFADAFEARADRVYNTPKVPEPATK